MLYFGAPKAREAKRPKKNEAAVTTIRAQASSIDWFVEAKQLPDSATLFIDPLVHEISSETEGAQPSFTENSQGGFDDIERQVYDLDGPKAMQECEGIVFVVDQDRAQMQVSCRLLFQPCQK